MTPDEIREAARRACPANFHRGNPQIAPNTFCACTTIAREIEAAIKASSQGCNDRNHEGVDRYARGRVDIGSQEWMGEVVAIIAFGVKCEIEAAVAEQKLKCDLHAAEACASERRAVIEEIEEWIENAEVYIDGVLTSVVVAARLRAKLAEMKGGGK